MTERKQQGGGSPLKTDRGSTTISSTVVTSIVSVVVQEVSGAEASGAPSAAGVLGGLTGGGGNSSRGVSVEVGEEQAAVDLTVTVPYGRSIPDTAKNMRNEVIKRVETLTGLDVTEVNITVRDVFIPEQ